MWSLAVEEQFYIFLPMLLFFCPQRFWRIVVVVLTLASFAYCLWWVRVDAAGAFYMLPSRAWELGTGAVAALNAGAISAKFGRMIAMSFWPALVFIIAVPFAPVEFTHPGGRAALICVATAIIILTADNRVGDSLPVRWIAKIGDISYSLYLVHWPVMVFGYSAFLGKPPDHLALVTVPLSLVLAIAMFWLVEGPARKGFKEPSLRFAIAVPITTVLVATVYFGSASYARPTTDFATLRSPNYGLDKLCDFSGKYFVPLDACRNSDDPDVFVWGDSYAMHLVPGLAKNEKLEQATFSSCATFVDYAPQRNMAQADSWAERCLAFNRDVLAYLLNQQDIRTVIIGSSWRLWVQDGNTVLSGSKTDGFVEHETGVDFAVGAFGFAVRKLIDSGKEVLIFDSPPSVGIDKSSCVERKATGKVIFGDDCLIESSAAFRYSASTNAFLERAADRYGVKVVRISDALCDADFCITQRNGIPIYRDVGHLSREGSVIVFDLLRENSGLN